MSATGWLVFSLACFAMAGGFLALSVVLFFRYKIPNVIGDLSGKRAAKEVAALRGGNESKDRPGHSGHTSDFKAMAIAHENKRLDKTTDNLAGKAEVLDEDGGNPTEDIRDGGHAELLNDSGSAITGVLNAPEVPQIGITQVLNEQEGAYEIQAPEEDSHRTTEDLKRVEHFVITRSITVIHTDEVV